MTLSKSRLVGGLVVMAMACGFAAGIALAQNTPTPNWSLLAQGNNPYTGTTSGPQFVNPQTGGISGPEGYPGGMRPSLDSYYPGGASNYPWAKSAIAPVSMPANVVQGTGGHAFVVYVNPDGSMGQSNEKMEYTAADSSFKAPSISVWEQTVTNMGFSALNTQWTSTYQQLVQQAQQNLQNSKPGVIPGGTVTSTTSVASGTSNHQPGGSVLNNNLTNSIAANSPALQTNGTSPATSQPTTSSAGNNTCITSRCSSNWKYCRAYNITYSDMPACQSVTGASYSYDPACGGNCNGTGCPNGDGSVVGGKCPNPNPSGIASTPNLGTSNTTSVVGGGLPQLTLNGATTGNYPLGASWSLNLTGGPARTSFTLCGVYNGAEDCAPNWGTTDTNGNWNQMGSFDSSVAGFWIEWAMFPSKISNTISFTVSSSSNGGNSGSGSLTGGSGGGFGGGGAVVGGLTGGSSVPPANPGGSNGAVIVAGGRGNGSVPPGPIFPRGGQSSGSTSGGSTNAGTSSTESNGPTGRGSSGASTINPRGLVAPGTANTSSSTGGSGSVGGGGTGGGGSSGGGNGLLTGGGMSGGSFGGFGGGSFGSGNSGGTSGGTSGGSSGGSSGSSSGGSSSGSTTTCNGGAAVGEPQTNDGGTWTCQSNGSWVCTAGACMSLGAGGSSGSGSNTCSGGALPGQPQSNSGGTWTCQSDGAWVCTAGDCLSIGGSGSGGSSSGGSTVTCSNGALPGATQTNDGGTWTCGSDGSWTCTAGACASLGGSGGSSGSSGSGNSSCIENPEDLSCILLCESDPSDPSCSAGSGSSSGSSGGGGGGGGEEQRQQQCEGELGIGDCADMSFYDLFL